MNIVYNDNDYSDYIIEKSTSYNKKKERESEKMLPRVRIELTTSA